MALFLSAAKNTQPKGNLPQYVTVRSSSFQLRALHNTNETIHIDDTLSNYEDDDF